MIKYIYYIIIIIWIFFFWFNNLFAETTGIVDIDCYKSLACAKDINNNKIEIILSGSLTARTLFNFALESNDAVVFTWIVNSIVINHNTATSTTNKIFGHFLPWFFWENFDAKIFYIKDMWLSVSQWIQTTQDLYIIIYPNNTAYQILWWTYQNVFNIVALAEKRWPYFQGMTIGAWWATYAYWWDFLYQNMLIRPNGANLNLYEISSTGALILFESSVAPVWFTFPAYSFWPVLGSVYYDNGDIPYVHFLYRNLNDKLVNFEIAKYRVGTPSTSSIYPIFPPYFEPLETLENIFYNTMVWTTSIWKQLIWSNVYSSIFNGIEHSPFSHSWKIIMPFMYTEGTKFYFWTYWLGTYLPNDSFTLTWTGAQTMTYTLWLTSSSNPAWWLTSIDLWCKTPLYNQCKLDITDGLFYCANQNGEYSTEKELCSDPASNTIWTNINWQDSQTFWGGGGTLNQYPQTYTTSYNNGVAIDPYTNNCLYVNPKTAYFKNPLQYCKITDFPNVVDYTLYNKICDTWSFYFHGLIVWWSIKIKSAVCATGNSKTLLKGFKVQTLSWYKIPYGVSAIQYNNDYTQSQYLLIMDSATWSALLDYIDRLNLFRYWDDEGLILSWSVSHWTILESYESFLIIDTSNIWSNDASQKFNFILNKDYYNSCSFLNCDFDNYLWTTNLKFLFTIWTGSTINSINYNYFQWIIRDTWQAENPNELDQNIWAETNDNNNIFSCDRNGDNDTSIIEISICPFTILQNFVYKANNIVLWLTNFVKTFFNIWWSGTTKDLFWFFYEKTNATESQNIIWSMNLNAWKEINWTWIYWNIYNFFLFWLLAVILIIILTLFIKKT
jgi:hypothetical protein